MSTACFQDVRVEDLSSIVIDSSSSLSREGLCEHVCECRATVVDTLSCCVRDYFVSYNDRERLTDAAEN